LFNIFLEIIIAMAFDGTDAGVVIGGELLTNLRFADDISVFADNVDELQEAVSRIHEASREMKMCINVTKTEIQYVGKEEYKFQIEIDEQKLTQADTFIYLGGTISAVGGSEDDIKRRIALARGVFQSLNQIWTAKDISKDTKRKVYEVLILSVLLYNSETWTLKVNQQNRLKVFEMACLRKIEGVTRRDKIRNEVIRARLNMKQDIVRRIQHRRLRYYGHIERMNESRYPKIAMYGYVHGQRSRGRPKKRWMDMIGEDCEELGLSIPDATRRARDRRAWRKTIGELPMRASASPRH
jgi:hypothetical protein